MNTMKTAITIAPAIVILGILIASLFAAGLVAGISGIVLILIAATVKW